MAEEQLENEVQKIMDCIYKKNNFLLSGGAGSGKTYSLVQVIKNVIKENPSVKVACMTYTNAAVKEIEERVNHNNLVVSTIHDFLWNNIKSFQKDLKYGLIELINDNQSKIVSPDGIVDYSYFEGLREGIQYKEFNRIRDGIISHDEVLQLANLMFKKHSLLCDIVKDKFKFIFIDEYQDTSPLVIEIFLDHFKKSKKENIVGFFGDAMQSIYDDGIGDLQEYVDSGEVIEVQKKQNRRNPTLVIDLANKIRIDKLVQVPSLDENAPNMENGIVKKGSIKFLYSSNENIEEIKTTIYFDGWNFSDSIETKELYLTHNLIAPKAGFPSLMDIYDKDPIIGLKNEIRTKIKNNNIAIDESQTFDKIVDQIAPTNRQKQLKKVLICENPELYNLYKRLKDKPYFEVKNIYLDKESLIDDKKQDVTDENKKGTKRDPLIKHLFKIQTIIRLYQENKFNEFIRKTDYSIKSVDHKVEIFNIVSAFESMSQCKIEEVIDLADRKGLCKKDDGFIKFIKENEYVYGRVKEVKYKEFQNLYYYLEGYTPFSTQHKIKGAEFKNVFVILDNGKWNNFNFEYLFSNNSNKESVFLRTKKIFYVCCTRAKENLVVYFHNPDDSIVDQAIKWFGSENVHKLS